MNPAVPAAAVASVNERKVRHVLDALATHSLGEVMGALTEAGVVSVPVKGIVLARWIYEDVADRPYVDVDLLVPGAAFSRATEVIAAHGWPAHYRSDEMRELSFAVNRVVVELHADIGRRDLCRVTVDEILARATNDTQTFPFPILRIDDIDHFLLLVANVVKDGLTYANPHQPADLERLLLRLQPRLHELVERARAAGFVTALANTTAWMIHQHRSHAFRELEPVLPRVGRHAFRTAVRLHWQLTTRRADRLRRLSGLSGLALAMLTPDDPALRVRGLARIVRRGLKRRLGRDPG